MDNQKNKRSNSVSNSEMFIGLNLLSKIGVIFIIIGVIAFSATSGDYLNNIVRMALVVAVGAIMLIAGEIFYRKKSVVFANALIYGGIAELFISVLIGRYGFEVFSSEIAQIAGIIAAIAGFLLSLRYKSQPLAITTVVFTVLPIFAVQSIESVFIGAACLVVVHAFAAVIAYRNNYTALSITGCVLSCFEVFIIYPFFAVITEGNFKISTIFMLIFLICTGFIYLSAPLLNASRSGGAMFSSEITTAVISQSVLIFFTDLFFFFSFGRMTAIAAMAAIAVIYLVCAAGFSLKFGTRAMISNIFINLFIAAVCLSIITLVSGTANYYALHGFAAAVLITGVIIDRGMLKWWGYVLLGIAELDYIIQLFELSILSSSHSSYEFSAEKIPLYIVNLAVWFGIMLFFIIMKKTDSIVFKVYSCLALLNAGILGSNLLLDVLGTALRAAGMNRGFATLVTAFLCACLWQILGFVSGRLKYLDKAQMPTSLVFYVIGFFFLGFSNFMRLGANTSGVMFDGLMIAITIAANLISVLAVLDITFQITEKAPKFERAVGLVVSLYGVLTLTTLLGTNNFVKFTSYIISILYIITAALWIFIGFKKQNALLRRFGLALSLLVSGKLFLFDFYEADAMIRTLLFIGFGITLLGIGFGYGIAEKKLKQNNQK